MQEIEIKLNEQFDVDGVFEPILSVLDNTKKHGEHTYLGWYNHYLTEYNKGLAINDEISAYLALASIYSLFYKHRTEQEVNQQLFVIITELKRIFLSIENQENYSNYDADRDQKFYTNKKWNGRHIFRELAILQENNHQYQAAINTCELAVKLGYQKDGTRSGMMGRIFKLNQKIKKEQ